MYFAGCTVGCWRSSSCMRFRLEWLRMSERERQAAVKARVHTPLHSIRNGTVD